MSIVESDGPPSWSLDACETGEGTNYPWVGVVESTVGEKIFFRFLTPALLIPSPLPGPRAFCTLATITVKIVGPHTPFTPFNVGKHNLSDLLANWRFYGLEITLNGWEREGDSN